MSHISVLSNELISGLKIKENETVVDGTLGSGGHSLEICKKGGKIIGIDADKKAIERSEEVLKECEVKFVQDNFRNIDKILDSLGINQVDKILFDLGFNSEQLIGKGFSFQKDEPLIMTYKENPGKGDITAREIVNNWDEETLRNIFLGYGGEKFSRVIAKKIVELRKERPIESTFDLVEIIKKAVPVWYRHKRIHFATKVFQALRIAVNDEIGALEEGLEKGFQRLEHWGRMAVISFHSLEDRTVKRYFKDLNKEKLAYIVTKKPIRPSREEILKNPRSRSAKLRIIEKI